MFRIRSGNRRYVKSGYTALLTYLLLLSTSPSAQEFKEIDDPARGWDKLWHEVLIDISIMGILFAAVTLYFVYKYRRRSADETGASPRLTRVQAVGWALIPAFIFMADDFFLAANGWQLWNKYRQVPEDRLEIKLESGMYSWDYTYPNGMQTQNDLVVPAGKPVMLRMTSRDTIHSHFIPHFRVKEDSMPGRVTYLWFYPREPGEHRVVCGEYCGLMHSYMVGKLTVLPPEEFNAWYETESGRLAKKKPPEPKNLAIQNANSTAGGV